MLAARRRKKTLKISEMGYKGNDNYIYLSDHLSKSNSILFSKCRELRQEGRVWDTWSEDCKIFVRTEETARPKMVKDMNMLTELISTLPPGLGDIVKKCKQLKLNNKIGDTWTKNGKVMVRIESGEPPVSIHSNEDYRKVCGRFE